MQNWFKSSKISSKQDLINLLKDAVTRKIIDIDSLPIVEAAIYIDDLKAMDIMIPRHQIDFIDVYDDFAQVVAKIVDTGHSRFPVVDGEISKILGVFHSKDLIGCLDVKDNFNIREHMRQTYFVPEIKKLDGLMYEMRLRHAHMAIVVDEFTNVVGLITLEMIIEQIIGDIEDEYDSADAEQDIVELTPSFYRVKGGCKLNKLNEVLGFTWRDNSVETVGGFFVKFLGKIPVIGEIFEFERVTIEIVSADSRKINLLTITLKPQN